MISDTTARASYSADGTTSDFSFLFTIYSKNDVEVLVDGVVQQLDTDYQVRADSGLFSALASSSLPAAGSIRFIDANGVADPPDSGDIITILRKQAAAQSSDYIAGQSFPAANVEKDIDKLMMAIQQTREALARALTFAKKSSLTNGVVDDPTVGYFARAKVGGGIDWAQVVADGEITIPVPVNQGGTGSATAADARTALGVPASSAVLPLAGGTMTGQLTTNGNVAFPATQNPSAGANVLDDYEEGTWTPSVGGDATYTLQQGSYIKVGKMVTVWGSLTINALGTGSTSEITGLPFACVNRANYSAVCPVYYSAVAVNVVTLVGLADAAQSRVTLYGTSSAGDTMSPLAVLGDAAAVVFTLTYEAEN